MAKSPEVEITILVPRCDDVDKEEAKSYNINLGEAGEKTGFAEVDWLGWPPKELSMDVVVGYDIELGRLASIIKESRSPPVNGSNLSIDPMRILQNTRRIQIQN